jgi:hypothetical protein
MSTGFELTAAKHLELAVTIFTGLSTLKDTIEGLLEEARPVLRRAGWESSRPPNEEERAELQAVLQHAKYTGWAMTYTGHASEAMEGTVRSVADCLPLAQLLKSVSPLDVPAGQWEWYEPVYDTGETSDVDGDTIDWEEIRKRSYRLPGMVTHSSIDWQEIDTWKSNEEGGALAYITPTFVKGGCLVERLDEEGMAMARTKALSKKERLTQVQVQVMRGAKGKEGEEGEEGKEKEIKRLPRIEVTGPEGTPGGDRSMVFAAVPGLLEEGRPVYVPDKSISEISDGAKSLQDIYHLPRIYFQSSARVTGMGYWHGDDLDHYDMGVGSFSSEHLTDAETPDRGPDVDWDDGRYASHRADGKVQVNEVSEAIAGDATASPNLVKISKRITTRTCFRKSPHRSGKSHKPTRPTS